MSGTVQGGLKCAQTNKSLYGEQFYHTIGRKGGAVRSPEKGFGGNRKLARYAGRLGGLASRKPKVFKEDL